MGTCFFVRAPVETVLWRARGCVFRSEVHQIANGGNLFALFADEINKQVQIVAGLGQNPGAGYCFVAEIAPDKGMGKMPVDYVFCKLEIDDLADPLFI